jgi:hypothetical protein
MSSASGWIRALRICGGVALVCIAAAIGAFIAYGMTHAHYWQNDAVHRRALVLCAGAIVLLLIAAWHVAFGRGNFSEPGADGE